MKLLKKIRNVICILAAGIIIATLLQCLVFALPTWRMEQNVRKSIDIFKNEGSYDDIIKGIQGTKLDNYTDSAMLLQAIYDGNEPLLERAMNIYSKTVEKKNYTEALIQYCDTGKTDGVRNYFWYWHGYMIFLKPLLLLCDYGNIRVLNITLQLLVFVGLLFAMYKKDLKQYIIPFFAAYILIMPNTVGLSLQYAACYYIMMITSLCMVWFYDTLKKNSWFYLLFLFSGMCTSFFDYLTYPMVTLGIPMIYYYLYNTENKFSYLIKTMFSNGISWLSGYVGMWAGKWLVSSIILHQNSFVKAIEKIAQHTGNRENGNIVEYTLLDVFKLNFQWVSEFSYIAIIIIALFYSFYISKKNGGITKKNIRLSLPLIVTACIPIFWYIFSNTHAYYHYWMEYRHCAILVFALLSFFIKVSKGQK